VWCDENRAGSLACGIIACTRQYRAAVPHSSTAQQYLRAAEKVHGEEDKPGPVPEGDADQREKANV
jgi:hypothetical protein